MLRLAKIAALISAVILLNAVTTLLFVQSRVPAAAQVGPAACVDGDVNGDAGLNIGDPIYLLQHLFQGGPGPVACAQGPTPSELESVLAKFFPRHGELWEFETFWLQADTVLAKDVLVVPAGKRLVLTGVQRYHANDSGQISSFGMMFPLGAILIRNGQEIADFGLEMGVRYDSSSLGSGVGRGFRLFDAGDVIQVGRTSWGPPNGHAITLFGYFTDAP